MGVPRELGDLSEGRNTADLGRTNIIIFARIRISTLS